MEEKRKKPTKLKLFGANRFVWVYKTVTVILLRETDQELFMNKINESKKIVLIESRKVHANLYGSSFAGIPFIELTMASKLFKTEQDVLIFFNPQNIEQCQKKKISPTKDKKPKTQARKPL